MPLIEYVPRTFAPASLRVIRLANEILEEYTEAGYDLTLRQLYYQFVSRGLIPNKDSEYKKLGSIVNDARLAGRIDWDHIVDRTRYLRTVSSWDSPASIIRSAAAGFQRDLWADQPVRVEVWIEKDALVGVIERACADLRVPFLSCRGYTSQSEMWSAAQRIYQHTVDGQRVKVLHLGDHDPSGLDMTRDIEDRLRLFLAVDYAQADGNTRGDYDDPVEWDELAAGCVEWTYEWFELDRLALNWDQIEQYTPPPNPAKLTDSRGAAYVEEYGYESWELDALEPNVIGDLIRDAVLLERDEDTWAQAVVREKKEASVLKAAAERWPDVVKLLS